MNKLTLSVIVSMNFGCGCRFAKEGTVGGENSFENVQEAVRNSTAGRHGDLAECLHNEAIQIPSVQHYGRMRNSRATGSLEVRFCAGLENE